MKNLALATFLLLASSLVATAQELRWPPTMPGGKTVATFSSDELLQPGANLRDGVKIARTAPQVDFAYYSGQDYPGNPWSVWGDSLAVGDVYYSAIGDHIGPEGNAFVYAYNSKTKELREVVDLRAVLKLPAGHYTPGKIHSRIDMGSDGWLYFSTHRGSTRVTIPKFHYKGDWIFRHHPETGKTEVVAHAPLPNQCLPSSILDPERLIFYAGTADGDFKNKRVQFLAYDCKNRKVLYSDDYGPPRYAIFSSTTGRLYWHGQRSSPNASDGSAALVRFDPEKPGKPTPIKAQVGLRSATLETPQGLVYTIDHDHIWSFDVKTEQAKHLGPSAVASKTYTTSIDAGPTGRYLYYVPGSHGGAEQDGTPIVQYDTKTRTRKVICFLHPALHKRFGYIAVGTFGSAVSPEGDKLYVTWNGNRGTKEVGRRVRFNTCAMTVIHIPESERQP